MRTPFVAANWKMFKTVHEAVSYVKEFRALVKDVHDVEIVLAPPFTALHAVSDACHGSAIGVAGQNLSPEKEGAFTGEISAAMLVEAGARYVVIGHSERRRLFGDTNTIVNLKTRAALGAGLEPIVCIGETLEERQAARTHVVLDAQLNEGLDGLTADEVAHLVVAYEPVWAIGTGVHATPQQAGDAHAHIRGRLKQWFGADAAERCHLIYGGSVKPDNIRALAALADVDGALVGGASLTPATFLEIVMGSRKAV